MGLETIAIIGLSLLQANQQMRTAESQAKATVRQGELAAGEKAKETRLRAARVQSSFLNSGLTLEGTPMMAIQDTFSTGLADVDQIRENANASSKNIISQGRAEALGTIASSVSGSFGSGDLFGGSSGFTVPFTGSAPSISDGGLPMPGRKPTRINF